MQVFFFTLRLTVSNILKKKVYILYNRIIVCIVGTISLSTNSIGKNDEFFFLNKKSCMENILLWKLFAATTNRMSWEVCFKKYRIGRSDWTFMILIKQHSRRAIGALSNFVVRSYFRFFIERPPERRVFPSFKFYRKSTFATYDFTASSIRLKLIAAWLNSSSRVSSWTHPKGRVCSSSLSARPRRLCQLPHLWWVSKVVRRWRNRPPTTRSSGSRWTLCSSTMPLRHRYRSPRGQRVRDKLPAGWHDSLQEYRPSSWFAPWYIDPRWC